MIVIISGPVGAGKSAVTAELARGEKDGLVVIEGDAFWPFIVKERRKQSPHERFTMTMRAMLSAAHHYARDDYRVLLDFSIPVNYLPAVKKLLRGEPFHYVVLLPSEETCADRAAARDEGRILDYTPYREFYRDFFADDRHIISDDDASPAALATTIRAGIDDGRFLIG